VGTRTAPKKSRKETLAEVQVLVNEGRGEAVVALIDRLLDENLRLELLNAKLRKHRFGSKSEKLDPQQLVLVEEELANESGEVEPPLEHTPEHVIDEGQSRSETSEKKLPRRGHRKPLPPDLPRQTIVIPVPEDQRCCSGCKKPMERIGAEVSEVIELIPARIEIQRYEREKLACPHCHGGGVTTAPPPVKVVDKGLAGPGMLAHVVVSKHQDHLPIYRQRQMLLRQGIDLSQATLGRWSMQAAALGLPIAQAIRERVLAAYVLQTDDTHLRVLDRDHPQGIRRGFLWAYIGDARWAYFDYTSSREKEGPLAFLAERRGFVQADAYSGYNALFEDKPGKPAPCREVGCWAHARRRFVEALDGGELHAVVPLRLLQALYRVERQLTQEKVSPEVRAKVRQEQARPILAELHAWLEPRRDRWPPKSPLADAIGYALNQWDALGVYLEDGQLDIDNTRVERLIRMVAVGRRNYLFAGSDDGARHGAVHYTLIATCRLHGIDAQAYLADVYAKIAGGWPHRLLAELLPDAWLRAHPDAPRSPFPA
jgi:transposase